MPVSGREQAALHEYRQEELGAFGQLLHIEIAAVLARRQGAQPGETARSNRHRAGGVRREGKPAFVDNPLLARVHSASFAADGATADTPMNGAPGIRTPGISAEPPSRRQSSNERGTGQ